MSQRLSERSSLRHADGVSLSASLPKVTGLVLDTTRSSAVVLERKHQSTENKC